MENKDKQLMELQNMARTYGDTAVFITVIEERNMLRRAAGHLKTACGILAAVVFIQLAAIIILLVG